MKENKQIEEIKNDLCNIECKGMKCNVCYAGCEYRILAEALYNAGYRKQSESISCGHENDGEWIDVEDTFLYRYKCSLCGEIKLGKMTNFCPNCGAKMKGGEE